MNGDPQRETRGLVSICHVESWSFSQTTPHSLSLSPASEGDGMMPCHDGTDGDRVTGLAPTAAETDAGRHQRDNDAGDAREESVH